MKSFFLFLFWFFFFFCKDEKSICSIMKSNCHDCLMWCKCLMSPAQCPSFTRVRQQMAAYSEKMHLTLEMVQLAMLLMKKSQTFASVYKKWLS